MNQTLLTLVLLMVTSVQLGAQDIDVRGKLLSAGVAVPFANVVLKGIPKGAATDMEGRFTIKAPGLGNYTLQISAVGFKAKEQRFSLDKVGPHDLGNIAIQADAVTLAKW